MAVEGDLGHGLGHGDGCAGKGSRLKRAIEFGWCGAREPVHFEFFGLAKLFSEGGVGLGDAFLLFVDEGLTQREEEPVTVGDKDVVKEFAEFWIIGGGRILLHRAEKVCVGPPFVADELVDQGKAWGGLSTKTNSESLLDP